MNDYNKKLGPTFPYKSRLSRFAPSVVRASHIDTLATPHLKPARVVQDLELQNTLQYHFAHCTTHHAFANMVKIATIERENSSFASEEHAGYVCVFAGATSGIGASTIETLAVMLHEPTFYVLGRSAAQFEKHSARLQSLNSGMKVVFVEADVSLLAEVDEACKRISASEKKVDVLFMSQGYYPLNGAQCKVSSSSCKPVMLTAFVDTKEGIELCFSLSYYSRMRLITNLLPLLRQSHQPRVLSVLQGGHEKARLDADIGLLQNWTTNRLIAHAATMNTLALDHLAKNYPSITFLHGFPGLVRTSIFTRLTPPEGSSMLWMFAVWLVKSIIGFLMQLVGTSPEESGKRQAYNLTTDKWSPGLALIGDKSEFAPAPAVLETYREDGWAEKVWEHTMQIFDNASRD